MIQKLRNVLGIADQKLEDIDPDESYVLTVDNVMKMLAIHMRFRFFHYILPISLW